MVYRFNRDFDGEVVADQHAEGMGSYLGHHFPEADIPAQARALYVLNTTRIIPDAHYRAEPLLPDRHPETGRPIDLTYSTLRGVSPLHCKYLQNMGVTASMSISVVRRGQLAALIVCHHRTPRFVSYRVRQTTDRLARLLADQIETFEERLVSAATDIVERAFAAITPKTRSAGPKGIVTVLGLSLLDVLQASGLALLSDEILVRIDNTPDEATLREIVAAIPHGPHGEIFTSDRIAALYPLTEKFGQAFCGVMAVKLPRKQGWLLWFRPEWQHKRVWAGRPVGYVSAGGEINPRRSFAAWIERRRGFSRPWEETDIAAARRFAKLLVPEIPPRAFEASPERYC
jgi:light-regulated signal transduction histidine kinase (bacteriophytochrome)